MSGLRRAFVLAIACLLGSCTGEPNSASDSAQAVQPLPKASSSQVVDDRFSYAQPHLVRITELELDLALDFGRRQLSGTATYTLNWRSDDGETLVLDSRDLHIYQVQGYQDDRWVPLEYALAKPDPVFGSKLSIVSPEQHPRIRVEYTTSPTASGLQWLTPAMTAGGKTPFMFSQSQQIHARSWVPLQDTPQVRFTYTAQIRAPQEVMVLMSADNDPQAERDGEYRFNMPQPIPSYLLAIAAGDLVFKPISERSGVWAEPSAVDAAVAEFADTETMIAVTEKLYGPYRWGRYDMLVLPPSFPYGGMENPRLSFITPTVIVGDKSLVSLIAHELAHSWSGNLVTFAAPHEGWLNEGFTSYVESRIVEELYGTGQVAMERTIARNALRVKYAEIEPELELLAPEPGVLATPDESSSATIYTKGAWFLQFLEERFGRDVFDPFLRGYFDHFAFQSITNSAFLDYLKQHLLEPYPGRVRMSEVEGWLFQPGIPAQAPVTRSQRFSAVDQAREQWLMQGELPQAELTQAWVTQEWVYFLEGMPATLEAAQLAALDAAYGFTGTANGEIAQRWYPLSIRSDYVAARPAIANFLRDVGRRKLIMPSYRALVATPTGLAFAQQIFERARPGYHPITTGSVDTVIRRAQQRFEAQQEE